MTATITDFAYIAKSVYEPTKAASAAFCQNHGWEYADFRAGVFTSGFQGAVYFKKGSNPREYVVAFKGSKPPLSTTGISDWLINDGAIGLRQIPTQHGQAVALIEQAVGKIGPDASLTLVGHSLGGALVQYVAAYMLYAHNKSYRFVNFNGPGMKKNVDQALKNLNVHGFNYICSTDPIGNHPAKDGHSHFGTFYRAPTGVGIGTSHGMGGVFSSFGEPGNNIRSIATLDQLGI